MGPKAHVFALGSHQKASHQWKFQTTIYAKIFSLLLAMWDYVRTHPTNNLHLEQRPTLSLHQMTRASPYHCVGAHALCKLGTLSSFETRFHRDLYSVPPQTPIKLTTANHMRRVRHK